MILGWDYVMVGLHTSVIYYLFIIIVLHSHNIGAKANNHLQSACKFRSVSLLFYVQFVADLI